jgi:hypothetical protein
MASKTRQAVASEATGPNRSDWLRSTAKSVIASPARLSMFAVPNAFGDVRRFVA